MTEDRALIYEEKIRILKKDCRLYRKLLEDHEDMLKLAEEQLAKLRKAPIPLDELVDRVAADPNLKVGLEWIYD